MEVYVKLQLKPKMEIKAKMTLRAEAPSCWWRESVCQDLRPQERLLWWHETQRSFQERQPVCDWVEHGWAQREWGRQLAEGPARGRKAV